MKRISEIPRLIHVPWFAVMVSLCILDTTNNGPHGVLAGDWLSLSWVGIAAWIIACKHGWTR